MGKSSDRWGDGLLIVAVASAVCLCLPALRGQSLALDEHVSYFCSGAPSVWELWKRCDDVAVLPPLSHLLERAALAIGGHSESVFRLPSLIAYVLAVPAVWWAARPAGGPVAGGLAALIVAWHPATLDEVRFARCYGLVLLLASLSTGCVLKWRLQRDRRRWLVLWSLAAAALCWTHYLATPLVAAQAVMILISLQRPSSQKTAGIAAILAIGAVGLSCAPLGPAVLRLGEWSSQIEFQRVPTTILDAFGARWMIPALAAVVISTLWQRVRTRPVPSAEVGEREQISIGWPVFLWLTPLAVIGAMALLGSPMLAGPRYRVMVVCQSAIAVGLALSRAFAPPIAGLLAVGLLALSTILHGSSPLVAGRLANPIESEWKRIGLEIRPQINDPKVLVFTQSGLAEGLILPVLAKSERFKKYAACRLGAFYTGSERALPIPILWDRTGRLRDDYRTLLSARGIREVWLVGANDTDLNAESVTVFAAFIDSTGFQQTSAESRPGISVLKFTPTAGPTGGAQRPK